MDDHTLHCSCVGAVAGTDAVAETEVAASAAVEVARIEGETAVKLAQIEARQVEPDLEMQLAAALAEIELLKSATAPPPVAETAPEVQAAPVAIVNDVQPEPPSLPEPEHHEPESKPKKSSGGGLGFW